MSSSLLLGHLQNKELKVPPETLFAALAHHLAQDRPTPTSLAASAVSAPFFLQYPPLNERIQGLVTAFHHGALLKHEALVKAREESSTFNRMLFSASVTHDLQEWTRQAHSGLRGGRPLFRLAACTGLLLGLDHFDGTRGKARDKLEDDIAVAVAEVLDDYTVKTGDWEREFGSSISETTLSLTLLIAAQSLPLLPPAKIEALPLKLLSSLLASTICDTFVQGNFLSHNSEGTLSRIATSPSMTSMPMLSKLLSLILGILVTSADEGLEITNVALSQFDGVATTIEQGWLSTPIALSRHQNVASSPVSEDAVRSTWMVLKTYLFATVMILDGVLGNVVYRRSHEQSNHRTIMMTPHALAHLSLQILTHLSFVISQFGGVAATYSGEANSFTELNKVFYLALDILNSGQSQSMCEAFVEGLLADLSNTHEIIHPEKTAFAFASIEQCISRLGIECLQQHVLPACVPYLSDPSNREIYESAHSVVLTVFASHAQRKDAGGQEHVELPDARADHHTLNSESPVSHANMNVCQTVNQCQNPSGSFDLIRRMVPFYAQCLIDNSKEGMLSTAQLRLAYAALVKGACSGDNTSPFPTDDGSLGWYCVKLLIDKIDGLVRGSESGQAHEARLHRLRLTLVSTIPSLPLLYLVPALEEVRLTMEAAGKVLLTAHDPERRGELVDALLHVIQDEVGDRQKPIAMQWWYDNRKNFGVAKAGFVEKGIEKSQAINDRDPVEFSRL